MMIDDRNYSISMKSNLIKLAGIDNTEQNVREMLVFMGVNPTDDLIAGALGYFGANAMEINMINLDEFLKQNNLYANVCDDRTSYVDTRN